MRKRKAGRRNITAGQRSGRRVPDGGISDLSGRRPYLSAPPREMAKWYEMHTSPTPGRLFGGLRKYVKIKVS